MSFLTDSTNVMQMGSYTTDAAIVSAVQSGKGGFAQGNKNILEVSPVFGGTTPKKITQDETTGINDITGAKVGLIGFPFVQGNWTEDQILEFDKSIQAKLVEFNEKNTYVTTHLFSQAALRDAFSSDIQGDLALV